MCLMHAPATHHPLLRTNGMPKPYLHHMPDQDPLLSKCHSPVRMTRMHQAPRSRPPQTPHPTCLHPSKQSNSSRTRCKTVLRYRNRTHAGHREIMRRCLLLQQMYKAQSVPPSTGPATICDAHYHHPTPTTAAGAEPKRSRHHTHATVASDRHHA
jgi:hypothetical protein